MRLYYLEREQRVPVPVEKIFSFFSRPENLQNLTPPWLDFRILEAPAAELSPADVNHALLAGVDTAERLQKMPRLSGGAKLG